MTPDRDRGIIDTPSNHSVDETVARLEKILQEKGVKLFALIDHSGEARKWVCTCDQQSCWFLAIQKPGLR